MWRGAVKWVLVLTLSALLVSGCGVAGVGSDDADDGSCSTSEGARVYDELRDIGQRWDDEVQLANSTGRMALADRVAELQDIRRETQNQDWPECAEDAQSALVDVMDAAIDAFLAFLGGEDDTFVQRKFDLYNDLQEDFGAELEAIQ